jgi:hypothetical protein
MSFFFSNDNRYFQTSPESTAMLTPSGVDDYYAAVKIQRWWRKSKETIVFRNEECQTSETSSRTSSSDNSMYVNIAGLRKRKIDEIDSDNYDGSVEDTGVASEQESEDDNEYESEEDNQIATVNGNNFLWDFFASFFSFFMRLFGLN